MKRQTEAGGVPPVRDNRMKHRTRELPYGHAIRLGVRVFLLVLLEVSVVSRIGFFGATPDLLLPYLLTLAVTGHSAERWRTVAVSGIAAGFLLDTLGGVGLGVLALFYLLVSVTASVLFKRAHGGIREELLLFFAALVPAAILRSGVTLLYTLVGGANGFAFGVFLRSVFLPELLGTLLLAIPIFFLFRGRD